MEEIQVQNGKIILYPSYLCTNLVVRHSRKENDRDIGRSRYGQTREEFQTHSISPITQQKRPGSSMAPLHQYVRRTYFSIDRICKNSGRPCLSDKNMESLFIISVLHHSAWMDHITMLAALPPPLLAHPHSLTATDSQILHFSCILPYISRAKCS